MKCSQTGLVYLENPPDYSDLESQFAWEKTYQKEKAARKKREPVFSELSNLVKVIRRKIRPVPKIESLPVKLCKQRFGDDTRIKLLDIGCGSGVFTRNIAQSITKQTGIQVIPSGIEISRALAESSNELLGAAGGFVVQASAIDGLRKLDDASVDLMIMHSFLEHEVNPLELLKISKTKLSQNGLLVIKVPNFGSLNRRIRQSRWCGFRYPDHVNYFDPANLVLAIKLAGLKVFRMNFFDRIPTSDNMWVIAETA